MRLSFIRALCLAALLTPLGSVASAQAADPSRPGSWEQEMDHATMKRMKGKAFNEARCKLMEEHEAFEEERTQVKMRCMNAKGQEHTACETKKAELRKRQEIMKERMASMHKMGGMKMHKGKTPKAHKSKAVEPKK